MEHKNHDQVFFKTFALVLGALFGIFFLCMIAARILDSGEIYQDGKASERLADAIKPAGVVVTDQRVLDEMAKATKVAREPYTGEQVVQKVCGGCHNAGTLGAPKTGDKGAWGPRLNSGGGVAGLTTVAIKGKGAMPPRGGDADLSDDEIKAAIEFMVK